MIYSVLALRFIIITYFLEKETKNNKKGFVGGALARCNIVERYLVYSIPLIGEVYMLMARIEKTMPEVMPDMDWENVPDRFYW